jgi:hypothetical protein
MELDKIEKLLEKYFEATTTVAEEEILKNYFVQNKVPAHLEQYIPIFQHFSNDKKERFTKQVSLKSEKKKFRWAPMAAAVVLFFGIYFGRDLFENENNMSEQELAEAKIAEKELKKALNLLAENFNRGTEKVAYLEKFETTKQKIFNE